MVSKGYPLNKFVLKSLMSSGLLSFFFDFSVMTSLSPMTFLETSILIRNLLLVILQYLLLGDGAPLASMLR